MKLLVSVLLTLGILAGAAPAAQAAVPHRHHTVHKRVHMRVHMRVHKRAHKWAHKRLHAVAHGRSHQRRHTAAPLRMASLSSGAVLVLDPATQQVLYSKHADVVMPIASLTKLMTALVVLEARQDLEEKLTVTGADVDRLKYSSSRLRVGACLSRTTLLHLALMSSENSAASALGRNYPGGSAAFVAAMNARARALGMQHTRYVEPTGLSSANVSTPADLAKLVLAAERHPLIRRYTTDREFTIRQARERTVYHNSNRLTANPSWKIRLQKTGYISEAGRCMVLHAAVRGRPTVMVFLDAQGKFSRAADANRVHAWLARFKPAS